jgi:ribosomal protein S19E (S16A)
MSDALRRRIAERLDGLSEEKLMQILDYVAFLDSAYNQSERSRSTLEKIVSGVEDTLRAARAPAAAVKGTVNAMDAAGRVVRGLTAAGRSILDEAAASVRPKTPANPPEGGQAS